MSIAFYIHIPFCKSKCHYCDFYSILEDQNLIKKYIYALSDEMKIYLKNNYELKSIYIGGGTPSILKTEYIKFLIKRIRENFKIKENAEITIEANPESISEEFLNVLNELNINRLSIGIQSFNDKLLRIAGRIADSKTIYKTLELIKKIDFKNFSADLIYGLPYQKFKDFKKDLLKLINYKPSHISIYNLMIEKKTKFYKLYLKNKDIFPSDEECADMYIYANSELENNGYIRYEISNFAQKGYECQHNLAYWNLEEYLGIGASAVSTINKIRWKNIEDVKKYIKLLNSGKKPIIKKEKLTEKKLKNEYIMLKLRLKDGLNLKHLKEKYNYDLLNNKKEIIEKFLNLKLLVIKDDRLILTTNGILVCNSIIAELI